MTIFFKPDLVTDLGAAKFCDIDAHEPVVKVKQARAEGSSRLPILSGGFTTCDAYLFVLQKKDSIIPGSLLIHLDHRDDIHERDGNINHNMPFIDFRRIDPFYKFAEQQSAEVVIFPIRGNRSSDRTDILKAALGNKSYTLCEPINVPTQDVYWRLCYIPENGTIYFRQELEASRWDHKIEQSQSWFARLHDPIPESSQHTLLDEALAKADKLQLHLEAIMEAFGHPGRLNAAISDAKKDSNEEFSDVIALFEKSFRYFFGTYCKYKSGAKYAAEVRVPKASPRHPFTIRNFPFHRSVEGGSYGEYVGYAERTRIILDEIAPRLSEKARSDLVRNVRRGFVIITQQQIKSFRDEKAASKYGDYDILFAQGENLARIRRNFLICANYLLQKPALSENPSRGILHTHRQVRELEAEWK